MKLTPIERGDLGELPPEISRHIGTAALADSSCSKLARTIFVDADGGLFLKIQKSGSLAREAEITSAFASLGFAPEVVAYVRDFGGSDFMLTRQVHGFDGISRECLDVPQEFCGVFGRELRRLHDSDIKSDNLPRVLRRGDFGENMVAAALERCDSGAKLDPWMLGYISPYEDESQKAPFTSEDIAGFAEELRRVGSCVVSDALLHGDACVPNIIMKKTGGVLSFSGFIDFDTGGVGDRHHDIFWALWSLHYNTGTRRWADVFLDAYGRDAFDIRRFRMCGIANAFLY